MRVTTFHNMKGYLLVRVRSFGDLEGEIIEQRRIKSILGRENNIKLKFIGERNSRPGGDRRLRGRVSKHHRLEGIHVGPFTSTLCYPPFNSSPKVNMNFEEFDNRAIQSHLEL